MIKPSHTPYILFSAKNGEIFEDTSLEVAGRSGNTTLRLKPDDFIELPEGSDFFMIPGRKGIGYDAAQNKFRSSNKGLAVAAFVAPAYTQLLMPAWENAKDAPRLPLFAYTALGWADDKFWVPALRVDKDIRQDYNQFDQRVVKSNAKIWCKKNPDNRLLQHIEHCATVYLCPAARNYFLNRWEMPIPTSPSCNSRCLGCISWQPKSTCVRSTQDRITFTPTPEEIAELVVEHLESAPNPVASFGQGCEGEPLMVSEVLEEAIRLIRKKTSKGIINLNTNASIPAAVEKLCNAGLDSIRVSMNSARESLYNAYYRPVGYYFQDVIQSIAVAREHKLWISINYLTFPGVTDHPDEADALDLLIDKYKISMIQWRNFNIDPDWYLETIPLQSETAPFGIAQLIDRMKQRHPHLYHGYFNPGEKIIREMSRI
ncbi:MAG: radical SAM protein [Bacteroidetes bacterium]|nr:radical SAM protein [Bacteroidota bacterium]MBU1719698.1 radical SAM protein [Bacteroidota bacterium]